MLDSVDGEEIQEIDDPELKKIEAKDWIVPITSRREGRERVISLLYEMDMKSSSPQEILNGLTLSPDEFVLKRFLGITKNRVVLDGEISSLSNDWDPERMPIIDRLISQLAIYELMFCPEVPDAAILSEAVELAQSFSTDGSGRFLNGLLSNAAKHIRSN